MPARGSVRTFGRVQLVRGVLARGSPGPGGRGLAFNQARDQLRAFVASLMMFTSSPVGVRGTSRPSGLPTALGSSGTLS